MAPYYTVPFSFSPQAWDFLIREFEPLVEEYQRTAPLPSALITIQQDQVERIRSSIAWTEVLEFSAQHGLTEPWPQLFIYKQLENPRRIILGNPHIDTVGGNGTDRTVAIRLNILLNGDENTEMVWWPIDRTDPRVAEICFTRPDGTLTGRLQAHGSTLNEQWQLLGEPQHRCSTLAKKNQYASFVRTDILHALNWTGANPRLIFSLRYPEPWSVMSAHLDQ